MPQKKKYCPNPFSTPETKLPYRTPKKNRYISCTRSGSLAFNTNNRGDRADVNMLYFTPSMNPLDHICSFSESEMLLCFCRLFKETCNQALWSCWFIQMNGRLTGESKQTVNHSLNFVDLVTGVHTQHAESNWSVAKDKFTKLKGNTNLNFLQEYLKKFRWRRWHGESHPNSCFGRLMLDIAEQYPLYIYKWPLWTSHFLHLFLHELWTHFLVRTYFLLNCVTQTSMYLAKIS